MKKRIIIIVSSLLILAIIVLLISIATHRGAKLTVVNDSKNPMSGVTVELLGYGTKSIGTIAPGSKANAVFRGYGDSCWIITVEDHAGKSLREQAGYVTNGLNFDDYANVDDSGSVDFNSKDWSFIPPIRTLLSW